jgi:hypothetical protein
VLAVAIAALAAAGALVRRRRATERAPATLPAARS